MKKIILLLSLVFLNLAMYGQLLKGAWERYYTAEDGNNLRDVLILVDGYQVLTTYNADTGEFIDTNGGTWKLNGNTMTEQVEFHTENPEMVGEVVSFEIYTDGPVLGIIGKDWEFKRIDDGTPGKLQGAWLMSGRKRDGEIQTRSTDGPRKTMKILSGSRFQWIAYNTETKEFMGTGGGTYTTEDGKYTENIEFFSRDNSRVGAALQFNYELVDGDWHHSGFSSKGDPLYEIWSIRE